MSEPNESQFNASESANREEAARAGEGGTEQVEETAEFVAVRVTANSTPGSEGGTQG